MLKITTAQREYFNEETQEFIIVPSAKLVLEHSLISVWKWESKWKKSFLNTKKLTNDELSDYVRCMTIGEEADPLVYRFLSAKTLQKIQDYLNEPMTATTFKEQKRPHKNEIVTAELIYYWMIESGIPFECEKWHLNRLLALIRVCNIKGASGKKMSNHDIMKQNAELNAARRKALGSKG